MKHEPIVYISEKRTYMKSLIIVIFWTLLVLMRKCFTQAIALTITVAYQKPLRTRIFEIMLMWEAFNNLWDINCCSRLGNP